MNLEQRAEKWACEAHESVNHKYDGTDYGVHLAAVVGTAKRFIELVEPEMRPVVLAACWAHDTIEDCRKTYNDVKEALGKEVAEIVYALTNEKGRTRKERAGQRYYSGIRICPYASFVKICDRLANIQHSVNTKSRMAEMYRKEQPDFIDELYEVRYDEMFDVMYGLLRNEQKDERGVTTKTPS